MGHIESLDACPRYDVCQGGEANFPYTLGMESMLTSYAMTSATGKEEAIDLIIKDLDEHVHPCVYVFLGLVCTDSDATYSTREKAQNVLFYIARRQGMT